MSRLHLHKVTSAQIVGFDDFGRKIVLEKPPKRIIALSATHIPTIFELGAGDKLIGVPDRIDVYCSKICQMYPSLVKKQRIGSLGNPSIEKIISLAPDLIITYDSFETPGKYGRVFEKYGLPYVAFCTPPSVAFGLEQIKRLGVLLGKEKEGIRLAKKIKKEIDTLTQIVSNKTNNRPLVFYSWGTGNGTYGKKAVINELIELAGGINLTGEFDKQWFEISPEYVIAKNPDVIVISYYAEDDKDKCIEGLKQRPGFDQINAVKNNQIYLIHGNSINNPIRFSEAIRNLIKFIHPEVKIDLEELENSKRKLR